MTRFVYLFPAAVLLLSPCSASAQDQPIPDLDQFRQAMQQVATAMQDMNTNATELVNFRELKAFFPEKVEGAKRTGLSGEKSGAMGMSVSMAEAKYDGEKGGTMTGKLTDMAGTPMMKMGATAGWAMVEIDREDDHGHERTFKYKGYKAYEKVDSRYNSAEINAIFFDRIMLEIKGRNVALDVCKALLEAIDLDKLKALVAGEGASE